MLQIGEFSKICQVSVKTLRHYDKIGLLAPAEVDRFTGYRYYRVEQIDPQISWRRVGPEGKAGGRAAGDGHDPERA